MSDIQDYNILDSFFKSSLANYNRQLFGDYDEASGYYKENKPQAEQEAAQDVQEEQPDVEDGSDNEEAEMSEEEAYNMLFDDENDDPENNNNYAPRRSSGSSNTSGSHQGFQSFGSYEEGKNALINQLELYKTGKTRNPVKPSSTLYEAMSVYAPSADRNNPKAYAQFIAKKLGVSIDTPISDIDTGKWADAIEQMEGNKKGNNPGNLRPTKKTGGLGGSDRAFKIWYLKNTPEGRKGVPYSANLEYNYYELYKSGEYKNYSGGDFPDAFKRPSYKLVDIKRKRQTGGVARTAAQQYTGLNDDSLDDLILPLSGENTIRGLDSGEPVFVQDEHGNSQVLYGPQHTTTLKGKVYEKRMKYQTGGEINEVKDFYKNYLNSPNYKKRLLLTEYKDIPKTISDRLNKLNTTTNTFVNGEGSAYYPENTYDHTAPNINIDQEDARKNGDNLQTVAAHEYAHTLGSVGWKDIALKGNNYLNSTEIRYLNQGNTSEDSHDSQAGESKADMDGFRFLLKKHNIYDTGTQYFNESYLKKARENKEISKDTDAQRFLNKYSDDQIIKLMNTIASNPSKNKNIAKYGKGQKYQTGGVSSNKPYDPVTGGEEEERQWLLNWHENRKVQNSYLDNLIEQDRSARTARIREKQTLSYKPIDDIDYNKYRAGSPRAAGAYYQGTDDIELADNLPEGERQSVALHELSHRSDFFPNRKTETWEKVYIDKMMPSRTASQFAGASGQENYNYMSDPTEIKSRLMQLRRKAGFKPDEHIDLDKLNKVMENLEPDEGIDSLMNFLYGDYLDNSNAPDPMLRLQGLLNNTVSNSKKISNNA